MASGKEPVPLFFGGADVDPTCRNWTTTGTTVSRMTNRAVALSCLGRGVQHCLGQTPRVIFSKAQPFDQRSTSTQNIHYAWAYDDTVVNGREQRWSAVVVPPEALDNNSQSRYWQRLTATGYGALSASASNIGTQEYGVRSSPTMEDATLQSVVIPRGSVPGTTEHQEGMLTHNRQPVLEVCVQDEPLDAIDTGGGLNWIAPGPWQGDPAIQKPVSAIYNTFESLRKTNLPIVVSWAAIGTDANDAWASSGEVPLTGDYGAINRGIRVQNTTYLNLLDGTSTARSATTAGWPCFVQWQGFGDTDIEEHKKVFLQCRVLAAADTGINNKVKFVGSDDFASNETEIEVTSGASVAWYGSSANQILLNSRSEYDSSVSGRAKVDVFAKANTASDSVFVYAIRCWVTYGDQT